MVGDARMLAKARDRNLQNLRWFAKNSEFSTANGRSDFGCYALAASQ